MKTPIYNEHQLQGIISARMKIISKLLLHSIISRKELANMLNISFPTIANHTQDLLARNMLHISNSVLKGANRPTQVIELNGNIGQCAAINLNANNVVVDILDLKINSIESSVFPVLEQTQSGVLMALKNALNIVIHNNIQSCVVGVDGLLSVEHGIIFSLNNIKEWDACSILSLFDHKNVNFKIRCCSKIFAETRGLVQELKDDNHIGLFHYENNDFRVGGFFLDHYNYGCIGTASSYSHFSIKGGYNCYCGRSDCFLSALRNNLLTTEDILDNFSKIAQELDLYKVGIYAPTINKNIIEENKFIHVNSADNLYVKGLKLIAVEQAWTNILNINYSFKNQFKKGE